MRILFNCLLLLGMLPAVLLKSQAQDVNQYHFNHYSLQEGLSANFTHCTYEDKQGFLWIGTSNGLHRYDGNSISLFNAVADSGGVLQKHPIKCLLEDSRGNLWVGTQGAGIYVLNINREIIDVIQHGQEAGQISHNEVLSLAEDRYNRIWIGTENGLNVVSNDRLKTTQILPQPGTEGAIQAGAILSILPDSKGNIWLGTWAGGAYKTFIDTDSQNLEELVFSKFIHESNNLSSIGGDNIWEITEDSLGRIWFCIFGSGLSVLPSHSSSSFINIKADPKAHKGVSNQQAFSCVLTADHRLWVASGKGLAISQVIPNTTEPRLLREALTANWTHIYKSADPGFGPISNKIRQIKFGKSGNIWLATEFGISSYHARSNLFVNHLLDQNLLRSSYISTLIESHTGHLFIGILDNIYRYDPETREFTLAIDHSSQVTALYEDFQQRLWIGTIDGLFLKDKRGIRQLELGGDQEVTKILPGPDGNLWVSTNRSLYQVSQTAENAPSTPIKIEELPSMHIYDMLWESSGVAWLATLNTGLIRLEYKTEYIGHKAFLPAQEDPQSLLNQNFMSLCLTGEDIWVGTLQGLLRFHISGNTFSSKSLSEGLQTPTIIKTMRDKHENIWVVSSPGIARWDEKKQQFIYFDHRHGLNSQDFILNNFVQSRSGEWIIAGEKGLSFFNPDQTYTDTVLPEVKITRIALFNKTLRVNEIPAFGEEPMLTAPVHQLQQISLNYQQNHLTLAFSDMGLTKTAVSLVRYRLSGLESDWNTSTSKREASYTNLAPSSYVFHVQARDHFGTWGPETTLHISISPPFWDTLWFRLITILLSIGCIVVLFYRRNLKAKKIERELSKMVSRRTHELELAHEREFEARILAEEANKVKTSFLSTMSHEIRTPLNAVIGTAHLLLEDNPRPEQEDSLELLNFSAKNLLTLINDVLDYSKIEAGKLELEAVSFNLKNLVRDVVRTLTVKADESGISIDWEYPASLPVWYLGDQTRLSQILINLIGNAIKFTPKGGVRVKVSPHTPGIKIEVIDTGIGIPKDKQAIVFEEFSQSSNSTTRNFGGTGLGLAITGKLLRMMGSEIHLESEESVGSNFFFFLDLPYAQAVSLPQNQSSLADIPEPSFEGLTVLIAEDNLVNQKVITKFMKKWGITHDIVDNGALAVEAVSRTSYDLVLMDMNMPVMDGIEATRRIRNNGFSIPILGLSAATLPEEVSNMKDAGMLDVIPKPFDPKTLKEKISRALLINQSS